MSVWRVPPRVSVSDHLRRSGPRIQSPKAAVACDHIRGAFLYLVLAIPVHICAEGYYCRTKAEIFRPVFIFPALADYSVDIGAYLLKIGPPLIPPGILAPNAKHGPGVETSRLVKLSGKNSMILPTTSGPWLRFGFWRRVNRRYQLVAYPHGLPNRSWRPENP